MSSAEFLSAAQAMTGSMHYTQYLGATRSRAYLSVWSMTSTGGSSEDILSVALDDLPKAIADQILAGHNPWQK